MITAGLSTPCSQALRSLGNEKRIRSLDVLAHRARELEHRAAAPDPVDLADVARLPLRGEEALLLDVPPERLDRLAAGRLALDASDRREGSRERHGLVEADALLLLRRRSPLPARLAGLALPLALLALAADAVLRLLFLLLLLARLLLLLGLLRLRLLGGLLRLLLLGGSELRAGQALRDRLLHHGGLSRHDGELLEDHSAKAVRMRLPSHVLCVAH